MGVDRYQKWEGGETQRSEFNTTVDGSLFFGPQEVMVQYISIQHAGSILAMEMISVLFPSLLHCYVFDKICGSPLHYAIMLFS